jgi:hypothetical protein
LRFANGAVVSSLGCANERVVPLAKTFQIARLIEKPRGRVSRDSAVLSNIIFPVDAATAASAADGGPITLPSGAAYVGGYVGGGPAFVTSSQAGVAGGHPTTLPPHLEALKAEVRKVKSQRESAQNANSELGKQLAARNAAVSAEERRHLMETTSQRADASAAERSAYAAFLHRQRMGTAGPEGRAQTASARPSTSSTLKVGWEKFAPKDGKDPMPSSSSGSRGRHTLTSADLNARPGTSTRKLYNY